MRTIKLMPDYHCFPLWEDFSSNIDNINPAALPISNKLKADLMLWAAQYDETLNAEDPIQSGFPSEYLEEDFKRIGQELYEALRQELGPDFNVLIQL